MRPYLKQFLTTIGGTLFIISLAILLFYLYRSDRNQLALLHSISPELSVYIHFSVVTEGI